MDEPDGRWYRRAMKPTNPYAAEDFTAVEALIAFAPPLIAYVFGIGLFLYLVWGWLGL